MRALVGTTLTGILFFISGNARAEPPPPLAAAAPPPSSYAPPPYGYAPPVVPVGAPAPRYPDYVYIPGTLDSWAESSTKPKRVWYGWQTLLVFGGSTVVGLSTIIGGGVSDNAGVSLVGGSIGGAGYVFGGPIVHWARGNTARGFASLGLNFGATAVGGGLGVAIGCGAGGCGGGFGGFAIFLGLMFGGSAGLLTAMIVDVSALSYDTKAPEASSASKRFPGWTILPDLKITREKTTFGVMGVF
jgi:hypothetical protein